MNGPAERVTVDFGTDPSPPDPGWEPSIARGRYDRTIEAIREHIRAGDTYQVNYTLRLRATLETDPIALYGRLCRAQRAPYNAYLRTGRYHVLSASPELFFRIDGDGFYVRTPDGHPVGYRYRVDPPPRRGRGNPRPVNGFIEVLPMPPDDVAHWPDGRFEREA